MDKKLERYFSGQSLYGDDFEQNQLDEWFRDEVEGYAETLDTDERGHEYHYHQLNIHHGFRHLRDGEFQHVLGFGSAYGEEILPIIDRVKRLTIVDPSDKFVRENVHGLPVRYVKPVSNGVLPFEDGSFDLILCLGVLHHIANVTFVTSELHRILSEDGGGYALIREPITSMGDWTKPRVGATKRERGIPLGYMDRVIEECGFTVVKRSLCVFPVFQWAFGKLGGRVAAYNHKTVTMLDHLLAKIAPCKNRYRRKTLIQKLAASSVYYVLTK